MYRIIDKRFSKKYGLQKDLVIETKSMNDVRLYFKQYMIEDFGFDGDEEDIDSDIDNFINLAKDEYSEVQLVRFRKTKEESYNGITNIKFIDTGNKLSLYDEKINLMERLDMVNMKIARLNYAKERGNNK